MTEGAIETIQQSDYKLIIFDCDGTLVDSEDISNRVVAEMLRELSIDITDQEAFDKFHGKAFKDIKMYIKEQTGKLDFDFEKAFRPRSNAIFEKELQPIVGVPEFIERLTIPFCVASNAPQEKMAVSLPATKLSQYFPEENRFSAYDLQKWKPEPDLFLHAAAQMGMTKEDCLVVEDSMSGAMGAVNAEMDVIVFRKPESKEFNLPGVATFNSYVRLAETFFRL